MHRPTCGITYCEGLPGLGKTTAVIGLAAGCDPAATVAMVAENNPLPADYRRVAAMDPAAAADWYLHGEQRRSTYAAELAAQLAQQPAQHAVGRGRPHVVCDKGALATLAYVYAAGVVGQHPPSLYQRAREVYLRRIRPNLVAAAPDATTVVFTGAVELGLARRRFKPDRALRPVWFDPSFLGAQASFYLEQAPELVPHRLRWLDASPDRTRLRTDLAAALGLPPPTQPGGPDPIGVQDLPKAFRGVADPMGVVVLGRALGAPFRQPGGVAQAFERHLLIAGAASVHLQAERWTPNAHATQAEPPRAERISRS